MDENLFDLFTDIEEDAVITKEEEKPEVKEPVVDTEDVLELDKVEEETKEEETEEVADPTSVKSMYTVLKEFGAVDETDEPTEEYIREQLQNLREKEFLNFVKSLPDYMQDTLVWVAEKGNVTKEDFAKFVNDFVVTEKEVVLDDSDSARKYIKSQKQFKAMFDTEDEMNEALDLLEDRGKLLSKARELHEKTLENKKSEAAKQVELAKQEKADKIAREKEFAQNIQKELESFQWTEAKKQEVLPYLNANKITETWQQIVQSPKAFAQFGDIMSHFKDGSFDKLYNILEGKKGSKEAKSKLSSIEKDSLSKLLKGGQEKTEKVKHDDSWWQ